MLVTTNIKVGLGGSNKKWFLNKGYVIPKGAKTVIVNVMDLQDGSTYLVDVNCDSCGNRKNIIWQSYKICVKEDGAYYCSFCANRMKDKIEKVRMTRLNSSISFEQWLIENTEREYANSVLSRWDQEKNKLKPTEVSFKSNGIDNKGFWFKCPLHIHGSELKRLGTFILSQEGKCKQCTTVAANFPELVQYFVNTNEAYNYTSGSSFKTYFICKNCKNENEMEIRDFVESRGNCRTCKDGISYPEKFIFNLLQQLKLEFLPQLTKTNFNWCDKFKYDFYIESLNCIIEAQGLQHFTSVKTWNVESKEQQKVDKIKKDTAIINGITEYIAIDCRYSSLEFIKNNIINSRLTQICDLSNIDWLQCHEYACGSLVKVCCDLWNNGMRNTRLISSEIKIHKKTVIDYLKKGKQLGWCDYDPQEEMKKNIKTTYKSVVCVNTKEAFDCIADACRKYNLVDSNLIACCKQKNKSSGKHPDTKEPLQWMYKEDYEKYIANAI